MRIEKGTRGPHVRSCVDSSLSTASGPGQGGWPRCKILSENLPPMPASFRIGSKPTRDDHAQHRSAFTHHQLDHTGINRNRNGFLPRGGFSLLFPARSGYAGAIGVLSEDLRRTAW